MEIREHEIDVLKSSGYLATFSMLTLTCIPFLVCFLTIYICIMLITYIFPVIVVSESLTTADEFIITNPL